VSASANILRAGDLAPSEFLRLLEDLAFPANEVIRCWLDAPDGWALDVWPGLAGSVSWNSAGCSPSNKPLNDVLPRVINGRIFALSGELKWRLLPALGPRSCRVVFLGSGWTSVALESLPARDALARLIPNKKIYPLWGQQTAATPGEWIDLRIPHRLRYPVNAAPPGTGRVIARVTVEIWNDSSGEPQLVRLCDLDSEWEV
jgi:hypothetical protein